MSFFAQISDILSLFIFEYNQGFSRSAVHFNCVKLSQKALIPPSALKICPNPYCNVQFTRYFVYLRRKPFAYRYRLRCISEQIQSIFGRCAALIRFIRLFFATARCTFQSAFIVMRPYVSNTLCRFDKCSSLRYKKLTYHSVLLKIFYII